MSIANNTAALRALLDTVNGLPSASSGPVYGKAVFFGDSLSAGSNNNDYSFVDILAESGVFKDVKKHGVGSTTIGPYALDSSVNDYCLINQITRYQDDVRNADIVFLEYLGNDFFSAINGLTAIGFSTDDENTQSISGYARKAFNLIRNLNLDCRLIWLMPWRWKGEGFNYVVGEMNLSDFLICWEASVLRIASEYGCGVIHMYDGLNIDAIMTDDGIHPHTDGHNLVAENIVANLYKNTHYPRLARKVDFAISEGGQITMDIDYWVLCGMLEAGHIDVYGETNLIGEDPSIRVPLTCIRYMMNGRIEFIGTLYVDGMFINLGYAITPDGIETIYTA